jgi:K+-sensing histidine kinase KdpD
VDTATTLRVFAHELRLPASVIQGYARMLRDGALNDADRDRALAQIQQATVRLADLAREASSVAQWLTAPPNGDAGNVEMAAIVDRAVTTATLDVPPAMKVAPATATMRVATSNVQALTSALVKILEATGREAPREPLEVQVRQAGPAACDVLVSPQASASLLQGSVPDGPGAEPVMLVRGGLGLSLLLAAAVLEAHHATLWTQSGSRGIIVRLPIQGAQVS